MDFLQIIMFTYLALSFVILLLYIPKIVCWCYGFKKQKHLTNPTKNKIALVIPAKNESQCIGMLLDSINRQTYDKSNYDVFIAVDRADDPTLQIAKEKLGDFDYVVEPNQKCKADALDCLFKHIIKTKGNTYASYIILDADCYLEDHFIEEMNNALVTNADVVIGKKLIKNWETGNKAHRTLFANLSALTYTSIDTMGNKYKSDHGQALAMCGQGMMLSQRFLEKYQGFPFKSLCEDVEVGIHAMLYDFKELYYEYALTYSEEPTSHKEYNKRRYRWLKGYFANNQKYRKQLLDKTYRQGKVRTDYFRYLYELVPVYLFIILTSLVSITYLVSFIVLCCLKSMLAVKAILYSALMILLIYVVIAIFNLITVCSDKETNKMTVKEKLAVVFLGPAITFEYVVIFFKTANKNYQVTWDHVERIQM